MIISNIDFLKQLPEELQTVQLDEIVKKYKKERSKLSTLSMTKYKFITDNKRVKNKYNIEN